MATARKVPTAGRKAPTQARSRETVDRIVDAATRVLTADGYHRASTNRIAAEAGVSPGSLYQYFGNKDEIVSAVIDRVIDGFADSVAPALRQAAGEDPAAATRTVLDAVLAHLEPRAPLMNAFVDRVPAENYALAICTLRARVSDVVFHLLAAQHPGLGQVELERRAWFVVTLVQHLTVRYLLDDPPIEREAFLDDLSALVMAAGLGATADSPRRSFAP